MEQAWWRLEGDHSTSGAAYALVAELHGLGLGHAVDDIFERVFCESFDFLDAIWSAVVEGFGCAVRPHQVEVRRRTSRDGIETRSVRIVSRMSLFCFSKSDVTDSLSSCNAMVPLAVLPP